MGVDDEVFSRLTVEDVPSSQANLVLAALISDDELTRQLSSDGDVTTGRPQRPAAQDEPGDPRRAYLSKIAVTGFRGIGPTAELPLTPGPGLTVVMGRNGSGKSSFAEGAELALTGDNLRWSRSRSGLSVQRDGWRNLHYKEGTRIDVALAVDGEPGVTTVVREWAADDTLDGGSAYVQPHGRPKTTVDSLSWAKPMELYRPFLSYSELGALVSGTPSKMHDALEAILGLEQLKAADERLAHVRKSLEDMSKEAKGLLPSLQARLDGHPDERAAGVQAELGKRTPDLDRLAALSSGGDAPSDSRAGTLRKVAAIELPSAELVEAAIKEVQAAADRVASLAGTPAAEARRLAGLLSTALNHQRDHDGELCPVCKGLPLDSTWAENTRAEVKRLNDTAADAEQANAELTRVRQALKDLVPAAPAVLAEDLGDEADPRAAATAWQRWTEERTAENFRVLEHEVTALRDQAADAIRRREAAWLPVATALGEWITAAKVARDAAARLADVKNAIAWLKKTGTQLRNARLAPFTEASARVWQLLRQESNVELGPVTLTGSGPKRKVSLDVTVDGEDGAALSVMSQGELHALGLALFLPRATAAASPFGFMVIDDPVQSMDPAKVDGLARVLDEVARTRQVVVFTHDDRLAAAIRQLQIPATVWSVTRRERSVVQLTRSDDPVRQYIDDALALALTTRLDESVKSVAVAGMCRFAIEAACVEVVRARLLRSGTRHAEVEKTIEEASKLAEKVSLVLFRDKDHRARDIREKLQQWDRSFADVFDAVNAGAHGAYRGDLKHLARHTQKLVKELRR